jgi:hypothetical protein
MRTFDIKREPRQDQRSWIDQYSIDVSVQNIGIAFPMSLDLDLDLPRKGELMATSVPAFLFSIASLAFGAQHGDSGQATVKGFSFQFVPR